jgi:hypothetical protein
MRIRRADLTKEDKFGWYHRYQKFNKPGEKKEV